MSDKKINKKENVTEYGETVCSEFQWLPIDKQKENAERFDEITEENRDSK